MSELLEWALRYVARGWPVLPLYPIVDGKCSCPDRIYKVGSDPLKWKCSPGKHPYGNLRNGVKDATLDPDRVKAWWGPHMWPDAGIAISLAGARLLDVAPDDVDDEADFIARGLPETLTFTSGAGRGHRHYLYLMPEGVPQARLCVPGHYDIMTDGYCVAPPSRHVSGGVYRWDLYSDDVTAVEPPAWPCQLLRDQVEGRTPAAVVSVPGEAVLGQGGEPPLDVDRRVWSGVDARDRSGGLWAIAGELAQAGANEATIVEALRERDQALGWGKFTNRRDREQRYLETARRQLANVMPRIRLNGKHVEAPPRRGAGWLTALSIHDIADEEITWYAYGLLGGGLLTEADGKVKQSGKTTLILSMAHAILERESFLGQETSYSPIVYLTEQSGPSFKRNLARAGLLGREDFHILLWTNVVGWRWDDVVAEAVRHAHVVGARVLIVDTLGQFSGMRGDSENSSGTAMVVMSPLQVAAAAGLAVLTSRHDRKSGGEVGDSGRGSSAYAGAVDIVLHLQRLPGERVGKERQRLLEGISRFEETADKLLIELDQQIDGEPARYTAIGDVAEVRKQHLRVEILAHLPTSPGDALSTAELKESISVAPADLLRALWELMKEHLVVRVGSGKRGDAYRYHQRVFEDDEDD
jgi:hypothetical protein